MSLFKEFVEYTLYTVLGLVSLYGVIYSVTWAIYAITGQQVAA